MYIYEQNSFNVSFSCMPVHVAIGFNQTTLIGREREEEYVVEAGFLTGQFDTELTLDITLILDTAGV